MFTNIKISNNEYSPESTECHVHDKFTSSKEEAVYF